MRAVYAGAKKPAPCGGVGGAAAAAGLLGLGHREPDALAEGGQAPLLLGQVALAARLDLVTTLLVCRQEAAEGDDRPGGGELDLAGGLDAVEGGDDLAEAELAALRTGGQ